MLTRWDFRRLPATNTAAPDADPVLANMDPLQRRWHLEARRWLQQDAQRRTAAAADANRRLWAQGAGR